MPAPCAQLPAQLRPARLPRRAPAARRGAAQQPPPAAPRAAASNDAPQEPPLHVTTPLVFSNALTAALGTGAPVFLKLEALQPCGSFKLRGIGAECQRARAQGATRFVSSSGGNAGLAVAHAARALGMPATVVRAARRVDMHAPLTRSRACVSECCLLPGAPRPPPQVLPTSTPEFVRRRLEAYGAAVEARTHAHANNSALVTH
jgi:hypothetical protein